jgi:predicted ATP-grasp superfamily ATP-dependent carboligase
VGLPFVVHGQLPPLQEPTLVVMLSGWIDASGAANAAMEHLISQTNADVLITFDADTFIDYRARRPIMEVRSGINKRLVWITPEMRVGKDANDKDVLMLSGPEPDTSWQLFASTVGELATQLGVRRMYGFGAYPYGAPHTRAVGMTCTTPDPNVAARLQYARNTVDVPAGVEALLEHALFDRGMEVVGLWAQVPHYISNMAYPAASAALIDSLCSMADLDIDTAALRREAGVQRERLDQLVAGNDEHSTMLRRLEDAYDAVINLDGSDSTHTLEDELPTMDELAEEVEQFLRDQRDGESNES